MKESEFKSSFAQNVFDHKYARYKGQSWAEKAREIVEDVCGRGAHGQYGHALMSEEDRKQLIQYIRDFKFLPGGRYIYYAGRTARFYNNCGAADTRLLTDEGWVRFGDVAGREVNVLSPVDGKYKPAVMHSHGQQPVYEYTLAPVRGRSHITYKVRFTEDHKWLLHDGKTTTDLRVGDVIPANSFSLDRSDEGFAHGFVFGDGNANGQLRLCGAKVAYLDRLLRVADSVSYPDFADGDPCLYFKAGRAGEWKLLPDDSFGPEYIASFIAGWIAADGHGNRMLSSINRNALEWFRERAPFAGLVISGDLRSQTRDVVIGKYSYPSHVVFHQNFSTGAAWQGFKVTHKDFIGVQPVFCPFEPEYNQIVIDHGIRTFNCFLLKAEEDTREEWANIAWRATSCLMVGGGIGVDYSAIRPAGRSLSRTGGLASGPLPLMDMINEIGRNVMQGGSRRSAIYASLNWRHDDAQDFLVAKNWADQVIGTSGVSVAELKRHDFNARAPLDMTNISLNYDDAWLNKLNRASDPTFLKNVEQAMRSGEPGFSFNFGDKQEETLRNACTEVTSEDDSDVCNLGSVNMGAIDDFAEFADVVALASKFLVCGTLRAELPYEKVAKVREKNRRLGLGLMGIHEWLLKREQGYRVTPDLLLWLKTYKDASERAANEHCDRFFISRPKGYRAIAPTGTIGILAGTTTGIEPLFAVAYRRRYLVDGSKWKYEYVVDSTAQTLIERYGLNPDKVESAGDLAADPRRRIEFQAAVQDFVDHAISSTINLPAWGTPANNPDRVADFAAILSEYAPRLRGFTVYPDGARGGQPITPVSYEEALKHKGAVFEDNSEAACASGVCGI